MNITILGYYIEQSYSSVQYKFNLDRNDDIYFYVENIFDNPKIKKNNVPSDMIKEIVNSCSTVYDGIPFEKYRWELIHE